MRDIKEGAFTGYYGTMFKMHLAQRTEVIEWLGIRAQEIIRESKTSGFYKHSLDLAQPRFDLAHEVDPAGPPDRRHRISYPESQKVANLRHIYWVIEDAHGRPSFVSMTTSSYTISTPINGTYRVWVGYRFPLGRKVSNVVEVTATGLTLSSPAFLAHAKVRK